MWNKLNFIKIFFTISGALIIFFGIFVFAFNALADCYSSNTCCGDACLGTRCGESGWSCSGGTDPYTGNTIPDCTRFRYVYTCITSGCCATGVEYEGSCEGEILSQNISCWGLCDLYVTRCVGGAMQTTHDTASCENECCSESVVGYGTCKSGSCTSTCCLSPGACNGGGGANTPPSFRLVATGSSVQGDALASGTTVTYNVKQGETITFSGMAWDCDDIAEIQAKDHNLQGTTWSSPAEDTESIMNCPSGEKTFYPILSTEKFTATGTFNRFVSASDASAISTSTIQVQVTASTNNPPNIPQKISPTDQSTGQDTSVALKWQEASPLDPDGNFDHYEVWRKGPVEDYKDCDKEQGWQKFIDLPVGTTSRNLTDLVLGEEKYCWNIIAVDTLSARSHDPWLAP